MSDNAVSAILDEIKPLLNQRVGPYTSWNPVSRTQVWQWCTAMGDKNPLYLDDEYRQQFSEFDSVVAPPTMMQMWSMRDVQGEYGPGSSGDNLYLILKILEDNGFCGVMAVSYDQTFHRYLVEGDRAHHYSTITNITDLKTTAVGKGFFVTQHAEFLDQNDTLFAEAKITYFQYMPPKKTAEANNTATSTPRKIKRIHPVENYDNEHYWQGLRDGKLLIQRCKSCATLRHPPQPMCEECQSLEWDTVQASGKGTIYSYTVMHYPEIPPFDYPNIIVLVDLDEGPRLSTQLIGAKADAITIGTPVEMQITEVQDNMSLPLFRPSKP